VSFISLSQISTNLKTPPRQKFWGQTRGMSGGGSTYTSTSIYVSPLIGIFDNKDVTHT